MTTDDIDARDSGPATGAVEARFRRELDSLSGVFCLSDDFLGSNAISDFDRNTVDFILEELFTNFVKYGGGSREDEIFVALRKNDDEVVVTISGFNAERFDIRERPDVDVERPLEERTPGGLGIHLIRKFASRIDYDYVDRTSTITIHRKLV